MWVFLFLLRSIVFLPIGLIEAANEDGWLRSLSYFVKCKSLYYNNTFYNFSLRRLATQLKCSPEALRVHLKVLSEKGLIRYHDKNITFLGLEKLKSLCIDKTKKVINVTVDKDQLTILRGKIVQLNLNRQCYRLKRMGILLPHRQKFLRDENETCGHNITLSNKGFGRLFNLSTATGNIIKKKLVALKQIEAKRCIKVFYHNVDYLGFRTLLKNNKIPAYSKHFNGKVVADTSSVIEYIDSNKPTLSILQGSGIRRY